MLHLLMKDIISGPLTFKAAVIALPPGFEDDVIALPAESYQSVISTHESMSKPISEPIYIPKFRLESMPGSMSMLMLIPESIIMSVLKFSFC